MRHRVFILLTLPRVLLIKSERDSNRLIVRATVRHLGFDICPDICLAGK